MGICYVLTDLDGTLLRDDASLSEYTKETINNILAEGDVISYATARSFKSAHAITEGVLWKYPIVAYNGAALYDPLQGKILGGSWLVSEITNEVIKAGKKLGLTPFLYGIDLDNKEKALHEPAESYKTVRIRINDPRYQELNKLVSPVGFRTTKITYIDSYENLEPLKASLEESFGDQVCIHFMRDTYFKENHWLELSHPKANKEHGLLLWAEHVGCKPEDITVFGDNLNDLGLFAKAGRRVAMANAHPDLKALADEIALSNEEDGVARHMLKRGGVKVQGSSKLVFFDMGNTLLHFHRGKTDQKKNIIGLACLTSYLKHFNNTINEEDVKVEFFDAWMKGITSRRIDYVEYPVDSFLNGFLKRYGVQLNSLQIIEAMNHYYTEYRDCVWCEDGLPQLLRGIKSSGYKIGVISNSRLPDEIMLNCFKKVGLFELIDTFTFSYYLRVAKPRHEIFREAYAKMALETANVTMIGDNLESDIKPAQDLGWTGIWYCPENKQNKTNIIPDFHIRSLNEVPNILKLKFRKS